MSLIRSAVNPHNYGRAEPKLRRTERRARKAQVQWNQCLTFCEMRNHHPEAAHLLMRGVSCAIAVQRF